MLTDDQRQEVVGAFFKEFDARGAIPQEASEKRFVLVVGGFPGSGKTTAARMLKQFLPEAVHVQSNDARVLLQERGLPYGKNVHAVMQVVLERLLSEGHPVIQDGMMLASEERELLKKITEHYKAKLGFVAITGDPNIVEQRARARYADNKTPSFNDWRASKDRFEDYFKSIHTRHELLEEVLEEMPSAVVIDNSGSIQELQDEIDEILPRLRREL